MNLEARYHSSDGTTVMRRSIPLISIQDRGPVMAESRTLFRFPELASDFANMLVREGKVCKATSHNWGAAVTARIPYSMASRIYNSIREESCR